MTDTAAATQSSAAPPTPEAVAAAMGEIEGLLRSDPHSFGFFQAVRLLERLRPGRAHVGGFDDPSSEVVRFAVNPALGFPASEIHDLRLDGEQARMVVNFMGLTGPQGLLPHHYSLLVSERLRARDAALADFLDIFHHRIISLFYEAWRSHRFTIAREDGSRDRLAAHLADLIGLGLDSTRERMPFPDEALVYRAGLLAAQPRGAVALKQLLEDFFDLPAEVEQFVGAWYRLQAEDQCTIGDEEDEGNALGRGAVAGDEAWDQQSRVRVRLGPISRDRFDSFLPEGSSHAALSSLLRFYGNNQFDFEVQLVLAGEEVSGLRLGDAAAEQRLGWSTWICSTVRERDADETILSLRNRAA
jgi:type VI secretion system protein ImpH